MIQTKKDLNLYIEEDAKQAGYKLPRILKEKISEIMFPAIITNLWYVCVN